MCSPQRQRTPTGLEKVVSAFFGPTSMILGPRALALQGPRDNGTLNFFFSETESSLALGDLKFAM